MRIQQVVIFIVLLILGLNPIGYGFTSENIKFNNVTSEDKPDLSYVLSIFQDSDGYIWLGSYNGVFRFDGINYEPYVFKESSNSISNSVVHAIAQDAQGNMWFATEYGLNKLDQKSNIFTTYHHDKTDSNSLSHDHIRSLYFDEDGKLWIGTYGGGLNYFDPDSQKFKAFTTFNSALGSDRVNCLLPENDSVMWIGTEGGGITVFNTITNIMLPINASEFGNRTISEIYQDSKEQIWVGTWEGGLYLFNKSDSSFTRPMNILNNVWTPTSIAEDIDGNLWIGTFNQGIVKCNDDKKSFVIFKNDKNNSNSIGSNDIWKVFMDNSQIMWIGTFGGGYSRFDKYRHKFNNFSISGEEQKGLSHKKVNSIFELGNFLWIGTANGLDKYDKRTNEVVARKFFNEGIEVHSIANNSANQIWVGTNYGLYLINTNTLQVELLIDRYSLPQLKLDLITFVKSDPEGNIWFSIYEEGLFFIPKEVLSAKLFDFSKIINYRNKGVDKGWIASNIIWDLYYISQEEVWLATNKNIYKFNKNAGEFTGFGEYSNNTFYSNQPGVLWVGSSGQGLKKVERNTGKSTIYSTAQGLSSSIIQAIQGDNDGNLWLSTNKGISKFNPFNETFRNYDVADGLPAKNYSRNASVKLKSDELIFGNANGFTRILPDKIKDNPYKSIVKVNDIKVLNYSIFSAENMKEKRKNLLQEGTLTLNAKENIVSFSFSAITYSGNHKIKYAYLLEGFDAAWIYVDADHAAATYTNLKGGDYVFRVKATNADLIWSDEETTLGVKVKPPFYKSLFFLFTVLLLLSVFIYQLYQYRVGTIKRIEQNKFKLDKQQKEKEIMRLNNEKLDGELEFKKKELASSILNSIKKNEELNKMQEELQSISLDVIPKNKKRIEKLIKEIEFNLNENENWTYFEQNFNVLHNDFLKRFSEHYPKLTHKDLRICAFIRMNIDNKEIARTLNITPESLGVSRTRIRKKIVLDKDVFLNDYILRF